MKNYCDKTGRTLQTEGLETRLMPAVGVTVITHGFQLDGAFPDWVVSMGQAILDRADGAAEDRSTGSLYKHDPTTGLWDAPPSGVWNNSNAADDHVVLLYDWADESNELEDGWLEAAADALFAGLLAANDNLGGELAGKSFLEVGQRPGERLIDFHFIGHSRGAVLNSLVVERLNAHVDAMIQQVTSLDPHPTGFANDRGYVADQPDLNSRLFTYDNVVFADNYYRKDGVYELDGDFNGVVAEGAFNLQIPETVLENGGAGTEHSDVHSWYYGTVSEPFDDAYAGFSGAGRNHDGDVNFPASWYGESGVPDRGAIGYALSIVGGGNRDGLSIDGVAISAGPVASVFNGEFSLGNSFADDEIPGWERHGGGGSAGFGGFGGTASYIELNAGGEDFFLRHNPLYFERFVTGVEYEYWINNNDELFPNDQFQLLVGERVIDTFSLADETDGFVRRTAPIGVPHDGFVDTLEVRIHDDGGDGIDAAVRIDNVNLIVEIPPTTADFDADDDVDGADFLAWQRGYSTPWPMARRGDGDADHDGDVDADDLAIWTAMWPWAALSRLAARPHEAATSQSDATPQRSVKGAPATPFWTVLDVSQPDRDARRTFEPARRLRLAAFPSLARISDVAPPVLASSSRFDSDSQATGREIGASDPIAAAETTDFAVDALFAAIGAAISL